MADINIEFKDRDVKNPNRYVITDNGDGTVNLIPFPEFTETPGEVIEAGTPINALNMNEIVSRHNALYDDIVSKVYSIPKRNATGAVSYIIQVQHSEEQSHLMGSFGAASPPATYNFPALIYSPPFKKRFTKISYEVRSNFESATGGITVTFFLVDTINDEILTTHTMSGQGGYNTFTHALNYIVDKGDIRQYHIRITVTPVAGTVHTTNLTAYIRNFKIEAEDTDFVF